MATQNPKAMLGIFAKEFYNICEVILQVNQLPSAWPKRNNDICRDNDGSAGQGTENSFIMEIKKD